VSALRDARCASAWHTKGSRTQTGNKRRDEREEESFPIHNFFVLGFLMPIKPALFHGNTACECRCQIFRGRGMTEWFMRRAQPIANSYSLSFVYRFFVAAVTERSRLKRLVPALGSTTGLEAGVKTQTRRA
jgi:hypothetical protein